MDIKKAKLKFCNHRLGANKRNIQFLLTFEEWLNIWTTSGHWEERGRKKGQYCMSRYGDTGPYAVGNVFIQLHTSNISQASKGRSSPLKGKAKPQLTDEALENRRIASRNRNNSNYHLAPNKRRENIIKMSKQEFDIWKTRFEGKEGKALSNLTTAEKWRSAL